MATETKRPRATRTAVIELLNEHLATASDLASQLKQAHWNVLGEEFIALHQMFDRQAELVRGYVDEFAERAGARRRGARHRAGRGEAQRAARVPRGRGLGPRHARCAARAFHPLLEAVDRAIKRSAEADDLTTQDLFIEVQREIDRNAYFLRSHLQ